MMISITGFGAVSALGMEASVWQHYLTPKHFLTLIESGKVKGLVGALPLIVEEEIESLRLSHPKYHCLDKTVLMAIYVSRKAIQQAGWTHEIKAGINIGSSRGATALFEQYYDEFKDNTLGKTQTLTSPTTTLGNLSTWIADDLQMQGPNISHSITCSTGLHAVLNGIAWLKSGMSNKFLVGATEAPNTAFTIAQMQALKIYADQKGEFPSRALDLNKTKNTMCLGEGAAVFCLENGKKENALAYIESVGYATEKLKHNISVTEDAECFQKSMKMALREVGGEIDVIVMHAPGTLKGDSSEWKAIHKVFGDKLPALTSNKWKIGHTLGTSGCLSMELALLMIQQQQFIGVPYVEDIKKPKKIQRVMVNAVGFGGNAVSVVLSNKIN